jgi:hypothetical protein
MHLPKLEEALHELLTSYTVMRRSDEGSEQKVQLQFLVKELDPRTTDLSKLEKISPRTKLVNSSTKHFFTSPQVQCC